MLNLLMNLFARLTGVGLLAFSVYFGTTHESAPVHGGIIHVPSLIFVVLGLIGIVLASYQAEMILALLRDLFFFSPGSLKREHTRMEKDLPSLADIYYAKGAMNFRDEVETRGYPGLWYYLSSKLEAKIPLIDVQMLIRHRARSVNEGHLTHIKALQGLATVAPAVGMTGTILGLIQLLKHLNDFQALGSNMALAFITALYGLLLGNFVFIPLVNRLNAAREEYNRLVSQSLFWLDMVAQRKPSEYLDAEEIRKIA